MARLQELVGGGEPGEASAFAIPAGAPEGAAGNAGGQDPANQDFLDQESERIKRLNQRREFLSGQYLQQGDALVERGDLEGALVEYANALDVDPSNQEARDAMRRVQGWLGDRYAQVPDFMEDELEREVVRRQQARIAAEEEMHFQDVATLESEKMSQKKYEKKLRCLDHAQRWHQTRAKRNATPGVSSGAAAPAEPEAEAETGIDDPQAQTGA